MKQLMEQYRNTPMDLADASLVTAAEALNFSRIFTLDSDFYVYRTMMPTRLRLFLHLILETYFHRQSALSRTVLSVGL
jgi:hypothetical protein